MPFVDFERWQLNINYLRVILDKTVIKEFAIVIERVKASRENTRIGDNVDTPKIRAAFLQI